MLALLFFAVHSQLGKLKKGKKVDQKGVKKKERGSDQTFGHFKCPNVWPDPLSFRTNDNIGFNVSKSMS